VLFPIPSGRAPQACPASLPPLPWGFQFPCSFPALNIFHLLLFGRAPELPVSRTGSAEPAPVGQPFHFSLAPIPGFPSLAGELSSNHVFLFRWPDRLRFPACLVGNTAPKAWKRVKVAIRFRLRSPLPLLSVPAGRAQLMPRRGGEQKKKSKPPRETGNTCRTLSKDRLNKSQAGTVRAAGSFGGISSQVRGWSRLARGRLGCTGG